MTTLDALKQNSAQADNLNGEEPRNMAPMNTAPMNMTVEQRFEHWKRVGEANAKKYGVRSMPNSKASSFC
jgi:hypothetical protein